MLVEVDEFPKVRRFVAGPVPKKGKGSGGGGWWVLPVFWNGIFVWMISLWFSSGGSLLRSNTGLKCRGGGK